MEQHNNKNEHGQRKPHDDIYVEVHPGSVGATVESDGFLDVDEDITAGAAYPDFRRARTGEELRQKIQEEGEDALARINAAHPPRDWRLPTEFVREAKVPEPAPSYGAYMNKKVLSPVIKALFGKKPGLVRRVVGTIGMLPASLYILVRGLISTGAFLKDKFKGRNSKERSEVSTEQAQLGFTDPDAKHGKAKTGVLNMLFSLRLRQGHPERTSMKKSLMSEQDKGSNRQTM
ncbi:MAG: hypothetical protein V4490_00925 [Pseudomonadota bacterium]